MASEGELWAGYFYPETYDPDRMQGTLRNRFGERDEDVLSTLEYGAAGERQRELMSGEVEVPRTYDAEHVRSIHRHLFQDVYDWAGEYRTVPIFKGTPVGFADVKNGDVDRYLSDVHRLVEATPGIASTAPTSESAPPWCSPTSTRPTRSGRATAVRPRCSLSTWPSGLASRSTTTV